AFQEFAGCIVIAEVRCRERVHDKPPTLEILAFGACGVKPIIMVTTQPPPPRNVMLRSRDSSLRQSVEPPLRNPRVIFESAPESNRLRLDVRMCPVEPAAAS